MFCKDLLTNSALRGAADVHHRIVAVGSSSNLDKCTKFLKETIKCPYDVKCYNSYQELVTDPEVDIIYVATPHSHHFQNAMLALKGGKHVLCEKAFTVTANQARLLAKEARERKLFLMEAVWTRFFPLAKAVRTLAAEGAIGPIYRVMADLSFGRDLGDGRLDWDDSHRMINVDLAGGAMLDIGIYPLTWLMQILYHIRSGADKEAPQVVASMCKYHTGADENDILVLQFAKSRALGVASSSLRLSTSICDNKAGPAIRIQGARGEIQVAGPTYRPLSYRILTEDGKIQDFEYPIPVDPEREDWGHGMFYEADECARCLRDGRRESETMPLDESILIMEIMEEALKQGGIKYPDLISSDIYEEKGQLNGSGQK